MTSLFGIPRLLYRAGGVFVTTFRRNIGMSSVLLAKLDKNADPIQRLFLEKLQEYKQKSKAAGRKLVDATPGMEAKVEVEMDQLKKRYGGGHLEEFPRFIFQDSPKA